MNRREWLFGGASSAAQAVLAHSRAAGAVTNAFKVVQAGESAQVACRVEDLPLAQYFATAVEDLTGHKLDITTSAPPGGSRPVIWIGDLETNGAIRQLAAVRASKVGRQGILLAAMHDERRPVLLVAGGARAATPGAIGELLNFHLDAAANQASTPDLDLISNPALEYRIFWNWDHSTNWARGVRGEQEDGCVNPYLKKPDAYLNDFRNVLDYMGEHKLNGLILWGFLRDSHGSVEMSRKLVDHAFERGVRVLPGIGSSFYGGIYYEGKNRYNVDTWLAENQVDRRFLDRNGKRLHNAICPSQPENIGWLREGAGWLFSQFPKLGGANLENGDFYTCQCDRCRRERAKPTNDPNFYYDMLVTQLPIIEAARRHNPGAWMVYATYTGFNPAEMWKNTDRAQIRSTVPKFVSEYPENAVCQWTLTHMVEGWGREPETEVRNKWPSGLRPPTKHSVGLLHQGSQWFAANEWWTKSLRGNGTGQRYVEISELIRYTCLRCAEEGLEGLEILGEVSDASPSNEINYLAFEEFTWRPRASIEEFVRNRLAKIYGGPDNAERFLYMTRSPERSAAGLLREMRTAEEIADSRQLNVRQRRRWLNLAAEMARRMSLAF